MFSSPSKVTYIHILTPGSESEESLVVSVRFETCERGVVMLVWKFCVLF